MKIKSLLIGALVVMLWGFMFGSYAQDTRDAEAVAGPTLEKSIVEVAEAQDTVTVSFEELMNEVIQAITNSDAQITLPPAFNPNDVNNVMSWWWFIYGLVAPIGMFLILKFWPSASKPELILKSTSIGIVVLLIIIFSKGASIIVIGQAVLAFIFQAFTYDKLYNPLGLKSAKKEGYSK